MDCAEARLLLGRRLDGVGGSESTDFDARLRACSACRALEQDLTAEHELLTEMWSPRVAAPVSFAGQVESSLRPRPRPQRRWFAVAAALLIVALVGGAVVPPTAWADLGLFLRQVVLRESVPPTVATQTQSVRQVTLDEAQRAVHWRIRQPTSLPDGYRLVAVYTGELHAFTVGQTLVLHYQAGDGVAARHLSVVQLWAESLADEPIEPAAARRVPIGTAGDTGLFIDGHWVARGGQQVWERGTLARLIVEDGDLVIQLQADPRDGWDAERLAHVAASLR